MAGDLVISTINGGPIGAKNAIINGNFGINQRGVSGTVTLSAGAYGHDRWKAGASGCTYTFATSENVTTLTISSGSLIQVIEGLNLNSGTYTLSWTGTAQGKIGAGSYAGSGVTGTATGGTNLNIEFGTGTLSLVQFEVGSVATPFERRPYGAELSLCQRYFWRWVPPIGNTIFARGYAFSATDSTNQVILPVTMRAAPSFTSGGTFRVCGDACRTATSLTLDKAWADGLNIIATVASGQTAGYAVGLGDQSDTSAFMNFSSEL
jgi:hypothetical protein